MRSVCSAHLIILDLIVLTISYEEYELWSLSICNFLHPLVTPSHWVRMSPSLLFPYRTRPGFTPIRSTCYFSRVKYGHMCLLCRIRGFHGAYYRLGCNAVPSGRSRPTFRRHILPSSSGWKSKPGKKLLLLHRFTGDVMFRVGI
jgi:hypothetical protein